MIHTVCMPDQDKNLLLEIVNLQKIILALASEREMVFREDGAEIKAHFETLPNYEANAQKIAGWFTAKKKTLFAWLNLYAQYSDIEAKRALREKIEADIELLLNPTQQKLQVLLPLRTLAKDSWEYGIGNFFYGFYDVWQGAGFQGYLFGAETAVGRNYTRSAFVQHFAAKNDNLFICPICDASAYRNEISTGTYTSIDHFFPRSKYPHLSIHPLNLLPMCPACNSGEAGTRDPHENVDSITELLLPYHEEINGLSRRTYIEVKFRPLGEERDEVDESHALSLSLKVSSAYNSELLVKQVENFKRAYSVQDRWNKDKNLTLIDEHVFRRVRQFLLSDIERGEPLHDPQFLLERLELLMAMIDMQSLGQDPFSYVMTWLLMFHIKRLEQQKEKIAELSIEAINCETLHISENIEPIFSEIYCWAQEQQKSFADLRKRVTNLRARTDES